MKEFNFYEILFNEGMTLLEDLPANYTRDGLDIYRESEKVVISSYAVNNYGGRYGNFEMLKISITDLPNGLKWAVTSSGCSRISVEKDENGFYCFTN